jgi:CelD/BcsL family acetyltransferase involved in cellulose biosynthesis
MRIVLHRDIPDDPLLQDQWNTLVLQMERPEIFYTHQWSLAVRRAFGDSLWPMLVLAYEGEKLTGVAALTTDSSQSTASFLCSTSADYCDLLSHPDQRAEFLELVLAELRRAGVPSLVLTSIPAESATIKAMPSAARENGYHLFVRPTAVCTQVDLGSEAERDKLKTALGKKKIFRYSMNSLVREGPVSFRHLVTWEAIAPVLSNFSVAHVARFLAMGRISNIVSARRRLLLSELGSLLSESGRVVVSQMLVGERPIAWNYGFQFQGSWFWYQPTFDTSYERLSPGYCLLSKMISEACDKPEMRVVDLGLGSEGYKERFSNSARSTLHASLTKSHGQHMREIVRYSAAQAVKSIPRAETAVRGLLGYIGSTRQRFEQAGRSGRAERGMKRLTTMINGCKEIVFYQWSEDRPQKLDRSKEGLSLMPLDLEILAIGAISYETEADTISYILRSARRLQSKTAQGFALLNRERTPVHFCWARDFEGFEIPQLNARLRAPVENAAMIFDCWTPQSIRERGFFKIALSLAAQRLSTSGNEPWTFTTVANHSGRGIESVGFERKYSMIKKMLAWQRVRKVTFDSASRKVEAQAS